MRSPPFSGRFSVPFVLDPQLQRVPISCIAALRDPTDVSVPLVVGALLFVAGGSLRRADLAAALRVSAGRVERACAFLRASPPHGLALLESDDEIQLTSAPDCGPLIERFLDKPRPEPLSLAALEVLSIIAYEQPVTRADVSHIRATDSSGVIETLLARGLITDDPRFGGRGRPSILVTTAAFLRLLGLGSLTELPPRPIPK